MPKKSSVSLFWTALSILRRRPDIFVLQEALAATSYLLWIILANVLTLQTNWQQASLDRFPEVYNQTQQAEAFDQGREALPVQSFETEFTIISTD